MTQKHGCRVGPKREWRFLITSSLSKSVPTFKMIFHADLDGEPDLKQQHLLEAIQYRTLDRNLWV